MIRVHAEAEKNTNNVTVSKTSGQKIEKAVRSERPFLC